MRWLDSRRGTRRQRRIKVDMATPVAVGSASVAMAAGPRALPVPPASPAPLGALLAYAPGASD